MIANIEALHKDPKFKVECQDSESNYMSQEAGIRQGCPLSPYLFLLVMTVMFADIHNGKRATLLHGFIDGIDFSEILYADDTVIVMKRIRETNILLHDIENESRHYNMMLNNNKCEVIVMHKNNDIRFEDGTLLKHVDQATYLGGRLAKDVNPLTKIQSIISSCIPTLKSLDVFWKKAKCDLKWKLESSTRLLFPN